MVKNSIARLINRQPVKWNPFLIGITSDVTDTTSPSTCPSISFSFHREIVVRRASFALAAILLTNYSRIFSHIVSSGKRSRRRRVSKMSTERIYPNVVNAMIVSRDSSRGSRDEKRTPRYGRMHSFLRIRLQRGSIVSDRADTRNTPRVRLSAPARLFSLTGLTTRRRRRRGGGVSRAKRRIRDLKCGNQRGLIGKL